MKEKNRIENVSPFDDEGNFSRKRRSHFNDETAKVSNKLDNFENEYITGGGGNTLDELYEETKMRNDLLGRVKRKNNNSFNSISNSISDDELASIGGGTSSQYKHEDDIYLIDDLFSVEEYKQAGIICKPGKENKYYYQDREISKREAESMTHKYLKGLKND